ncbi:MAG TPA: hypothetical protein VHR66_31900, partial [Gemmataceae bacterium]|nr:hypothetical protein [Gemmataceae bacterium]
MNPFRAHSPYSRRRTCLLVASLEDRAVPAIIGLETNDVPVSVTAGVDSAGGIAMKPDGTGFIVTYASPDASGQGVFFKQYDANWQPVGSAVAVNTVTANNQQRPSVAFDANGNFVIVWESFGQDPGDSAAQSGIYARRFDSTGTAIDAVEFRVNTTIAGQQSEPDVAVNDSGQFVIAYTNGAPATSDIDAQAFAGIFAGASGTPTTVGGETVVNDTIASLGAQSAPAVGMDNSGNYTVAYQSAGQDHVGDLGIYARQMSFAGVPLVGEFKINTIVNGDQAAPDVAMDPSGNFSIVWDSANVDSSGQAIVLQRYDSTAQAQGGNVQVNTVITLNDQINPHVAAGADGRLLVTWEGEEADGDAVGTDVYYKTYDAAGQVTQSDTAVSPTTVSNDAGETNAIGAINPDGDFAILFDSSAAGSSDVYLRRFAEAPRVAFDLPGYSNAEGLDASIGLNRTGAPYVLANVATSVVVNNAGSGTATAPADFDNSFSGVAYNFLADGSTAATVPISIVHDTDAEPNETIKLALGTVTNGTATGQVTATYSIVDDDTVPPVSTKPAWSSYGHDVLGSRNNTQEKTLNSKSVGSLAQLWTFPAFTYGAPAVVNGVVYINAGFSVVALD